jgi:acyl transferase domain-containing protein/acyl carrier protein
MKTLNAQYSPDDIAVIGMAGRFPGARDIESFWRNLRDGVNSISFFQDEGETTRSAAAAESGSGLIKAAGVVEDIELFDASFFNFTRREAEIMDPQHRLFLECAWEALESAGYDAERYEGSIGVYSGAGTNSYLLNIYNDRAALETVGPFQVIIGNEKDHLSTQVSYKLNLKGPSLSVQTSCSTSLVAVSMACQGLLNYQCDMALAGGVSVKAQQKGGHLYHEGGILSPDGYCRAFDAKAQGTVIGNGLGIVVLKRLEDALADGDHIEAVIKGTAVNNDGSLKVGYTAPSVEGQAGVIAEALALAKVEPESVSYVETHGTGTPLGDPIEMAALTQAFRGSTEKEGFCAVGSVKTNIGHLNTAAGVAGLIKTVLALKNRMLPPSLHFEQPNPQIDFTHSPFYVNTKLAEWQTGGTPRRAGISSFGIGGTNAHIILEEAPPQEESASGRPHQLLVLSARTDAALDKTAENLAQYLRQHPEANLADVGYTLQAGRKVFSHRRALVCRTVEDAIVALESKRPPTGAETEEEKERSVVMMFPGQGTQYVNMSKELYAVEPAFREQVDLCAEILMPHMGLDLRDVLYPSEDISAPPQLKQTSLVQPALFVVEYALAKLWMQWGVSPAAMIGHSIGEYVAACLSGVMSLEDALFLVSERGRLMQRASGGSMLAVHLPEEDAQALLRLDERLSLAAVNGPKLCVVSGCTEAIEQLAALCAERGIQCSTLHTSHAFHSEMMSPILGEYEEQVRRVDLHPPRIPYLSNVTGTWVTSSEATDPTYWVRHLRQTVRFAEGVAELLRDPGMIFLEAGPGRSLSASVREAEDNFAKRVVLSSLRHPSERQSDSAFILNTLGALWAAGVAVDWNGFHGDEQRRRTPLPTYPFERQRYWIDAKAQSEGAAQTPAASDGKREVGDWFSAPVWKQTPRVGRPALDAGADETLRWLLFVDDYGLGTQLARRLEACGHNVLTVMPGEGFEALGPHSYTIDAQRGEDYLRLFETLQTLGTTPQRIVHLWSMRQVETSTAGVEDAASVALRGFHGLLLLTQALAACDVTDPLRLEIVSNNIHDITGAEALCPEHATVLGVCATLPRELPNISCRAIDVLIPPAGSAEAGRLVDLLIEEFAAGALETVIAFRGNHRWVQTDEPVRIAGSRRRTRLREGGVYLITDGLRGVGFALAEFLATTTKAKLVLASEEKFPTHGEWEQWLRTHDAENNVSAGIRKLRDLEEAGAEILLVEADLTRTEEAQALIARTLERFGSVNGVLHMYERRRPELLKLKSDETARRMSAPKIETTLALDAALSDTALDFFLLSSSDNSINGVLGDIDSCAGNAFLDAFAHLSSSRRGRPTIALDWGLRQREADELALDVGLPESQSRLEEMRSRFGMSLEEQVEAVRCVLTCELPQVVVSTHDVRFMRERQKTFTESFVFEELRKKRASEGESRQRAAEDNYVPPSSQLEQSVACLWQELLGIEAVGLHDNFFDLGGNSLTGIQLMSRLRQTFLLELPMNRLFESPTVAGLAAAISEVQLQEKEREELERLIREIENTSIEELEARLVGSQ